MFQFEDFSSEKPYCADTWMSINNWKSIYEHLESFVEPDLSFENKQLFDLRETPLTCSIGWSDINEPLGQIIVAFLTQSEIGTDKYCLPAYISIHVTKSLTSKFVKHISSLKKEIDVLKYELKRSKNSSSSKSSSYKTRSQSNTHQKLEKPPKTVNETEPGDTNPYTVDKTEDHEEYVPNSVRNQKTSYEAGVKYEPGRVPESNSQNNSAAANVEKYVPPHVSPITTTKPKYIPSSSSTSEPSQTKTLTNRKPNESSQISTSEQSRSSRQKSRNNREETQNARRPISQKNSTRKRGLSPDLFGTDDEASESPPIVEDPPDLVKRAKGTSTLKNLPSNNKKRTNPSRSNTQPGNVKSQLNSNPVKKMLSASELKEFMDTKDKAITEMEKLRGMLKPEVLPDLEVVTLKHFTPKDLGRRFEEHRSDLKVHFDNYCKQKV